MATLRLYSCALVTAVFAALWAAGIHEDRLIGAYWVLLAITLVVSEKERTKRRRDGRP